MHMQERLQGGGRKPRDFLSVVFIFFVKEQKRSFVENEVVGGYFRTMKKLFRFCVCCS